MVCCIRKFYTRVCSRLYYPLSKVKYILPLYLLFYYILQREIIFGKSGLYPKPSL